MMFVTAQLKEWSLARGTRFGQWKNPVNFVAKRRNLRGLSDFNLDKISAKDATASRHWRLHKFSKLFFAAMPLDVRKRLCPSEKDALILGLRPCASGS
jgi:hypothetical protein